jgi:hypothetical protein
MSKHYPPILLIVTAAALAAILGTTAAMAATTWTVRPGGAVTAKFSRMILRNTRTGTEVTCPATLKATLAAGTGLPGTGIGSVSSFTFGPCAGPLGTQFILKTSHLPYALNAVSYHATTGTTTGSISRVHGTFAGPSCSFVLDGTGASKDNGILGVKYVNSTHTLKFINTGDDLHAYNVMGGCGFLVGVHNGDSYTLTGAGTVTPAQTITSP